MNCFLLVFILMGALLQAGCALPRTLWLEEMARHEAPVPTGGKRLTLVAQPSVQLRFPGVETDIESPLSVEDAKAWYDSHLVSSGWKPFFQHNTNDGFTGVNYNRGKGGLEDWESADVTVRPSSAGTGSIAHVVIYGYYVHDLPSQSTYALYILLLPLDFFTYGGQFREGMARVLWWL